MEKLSQFLVKRRILLLCVFIVLAGISAVFMQKVNVVTDMSSYLPDDSSMKTGMDVMEEEFTDLSSSSSSIRVMFMGLDDAQKQEILAELSDMDYVESVDYEMDSEEYNVEDYTLYILNSTYAYDSDEMEALEEELTVNYGEGYDMIYKTDNTGTEGIPTWIMLLAFGIMMAVLFLMCSSWIEPFLFLITIGIAIVINMGTNCLLSGVSEITHAIASILQLVLSMDYSIILLNRYRQELKNASDKEQAMSQAIRFSIPSIASSCLTTVVGLLALIFMSFKIGADMGIVLAKGVAISLVCIMTVLPALILACDKLIAKTAKKVLNIPVGGLAKMSYKGRYVISVIFVILFVMVYILKGDAAIIYTLPSEDKIAEIFPKANNYVILYDNEDEAVISDLEQKLADNENVKGVNAYATTIGKQYTANEFVQYLNNMGMSGDSGISLDESMVKMIYYDYHVGMTDKTMTIEQFVAFIQNGILSNEVFAGHIDEEMLAKLQILAPLCSKDALEEPRSSSELAGMFGVDEAMLGNVFMMYQVDEMSIADFMQMVNSNPQAQTMLASGENGNSSNMQLMQTIIASVMSETAYTSQEMTELFGGITDELDASMIALMYEMYYSQTEYDETWTMSMENLLNHITESEIFTQFLDDGMKANLDSVKDMLVDGKKQLVGQNYSICMIETIYADGSDGSMDFAEYLTNYGDENFAGEYYLIGNTPMQYEMSQTFKDEMNKITWITAIAIFVVVLFTFKNAVISIILILLIQCSVYITMVTMGIMGDSMYYLALLVVQSILMGATIDYAIVYTNYYRENRDGSDIAESVAAAYKDSMHTILTSGLIMVCVTAVLGYAFANPTIGQIVHIIALGVTCALVMILFILPGILACSDKFIIRKK